MTIAVWHMSHAPMVTWTLLRCLSLHAWHAFPALALIGLATSTACTITALPWRRLQPSVPALGLPKYPAAFMIIMTRQADPA